MINIQRREHYPEQEWAIIASINEINITILLSVINVSLNYDICYSNLTYATVIATYVTVIVTYVTEILNVLVTTLPE